jgi:hypothetical protein
LKPDKKFKKSENGRTDMEIKCLKGRRRRDEAVSRWMGSGKKKVYTEY